MRKHDRSFFYKYLSFDTALRVVESKRFQWSSPVNFNDPFDHQAGFSLEIEKEEFARLLTESIERVIFSDEAISVQPQSMFAALTIQMRAIRHRLNRDEIMKQLRGASLQVADNLHAHFSQLNQTVHVQLFQSRVFCVTELHDNVVMWSHYAEEHKGVVLKLACIDEIDNTLLAARKVKYSDRFISFPSAEVYAKHLTGEAPIDFVSLCWDIAFTKHVDWSYEREWRVHLALPQGSPGDGYSLYDEDPRVFQAAYLGCRMDEAHQRQIVATIRKEIPAMEIYMARKSSTNFGLSFHRIIPD